MKQVNDCSKLTIKIQLNRLKNTVLNILKINKKETRATPIDIVWSLFNWHWLQATQHSVSKPFYSQCTLSLPPENIRKPYDFLIFSEGRGRVHWERMSSCEGSTFSKNNAPTVKVIIKIEWYLRGNCLLKINNNALRSFNFFSRRVFRCLLFVA